MDTDSISRRASPYPWSTLYFTMAAVVIFLGFFPSYFSRLGKVDAAHHVHGITASLWMFLLIGQAWLIRLRKRSMHRILGWSSIILAVLFVLSGFMIMHVMLSGAGGFNRAIGARLAFVDLTTITGFSFAYVLALRQRRTPELHARWMACTAILALPPAIARILGNWAPGVDSFETAFHLSYLITLSIVGVLILSDRRKAKLQVPYRLLGVLFILQQLSFVLIPKLGWWNEICRWIATF